MQEHASHIAHAASEAASHDDEALEPTSVSHFFHVLGAYRRIIVLALVGIAFAYLMAALAFYLLSPAERMVQQPFRLDFQGAGEGKYPNGQKFNVTDIIATPILKNVFDRNHLETYLTFGDFSRAIFVLQSNREYEALAARYAAALADTKLSVIDRDRLQQEFDLRARSIAKNEYVVSFTTKLGTRVMPETVVKKVLAEVLDTWADFAINQQHVVMYDVSVLSPNVVAPETIDAASGFIPVVTKLRLRANQVIDNIRRLEALPGAKLAKTPDQTSLADLRVQLSDMIRFRLEPLLLAIVSSGRLTPDRAAAVRFLETQLRYDQRQLDAAQVLSNSTRAALAMYEQPSTPDRPATFAGSLTGQTKSGANGDAVMTQLSDTFLDRLVTLTGRSGDALYRQSLVDDYRKSTAETIPLQAAVDFDQSSAQEARKTPSNVTLDPAAANAEVERSRADLARVIGRMNDLFVTISRNMSPSSQLLVVTTPAAARVARSANTQRLMLYGVFVVLAALPLVVALCLLHNRFREEEGIEEQRRHAARAV